VSGQGPGDGNTGCMLPEPDPTTAPPLFDQRNCARRSWYWLEGLLLGPRFEQVQRSDGIWIFQPVLSPGSTGLGSTPWVEWVVGSFGSTLGAVLLGLLGLIPDRLSSLRWFSVAFLLLIVVLGLVYAERRSELLRIAQEQLRRRDLEGSDAAAAARFAAIEDRIDQAGQQAAQQSVFSGIAVLQTLGNSSDPELARAARYFASLLKEVSSEEIELVAENLAQSVDRQFNQLQVEAGKKKLLACLLLVSPLSVVELIGQTNLSNEIAFDALMQLDGQGFILIDSRSESGRFELNSIVHLTETGRAAAQECGPA
jgi:hypothetical protein